MICYVINAYCTFSIKSVISGLNQIFQRFMATARVPAILRFFERKFSKILKISFEISMELFMSSNQKSQSHDVNIELIVYVINRLLNPNCTHGTGGLDLTLSNLEPSTFGPT